MLAARFGRRVLGVDAMPAFVAHATARARADGTAARCRFLCADMRAVAPRARGYGMVSVLGAVGVLGDLGETLAAVRPCVEPGGLILLDDGYVSDGAPPEVAAQVSCFDRSTSLAILTAHGDELLAETICDGPEEEDFYREQIACIEARARELAARHPDAAGALLGYVDRQREEIALLTGPVVGALWVLRRGG